MPGCSQFANYYSLLLPYHPHRTLLYNTHGRITDAVARIIAKRGGMQAPGNYLCLNPEPRKDHLSDALQSVVYHLIPRYQPHTTLLGRQQHVVWPFPGSTLVVVRLWLPLPTGMLRNTLFSEGASCQSRCISIRQRKPVGGYLTYASHGSHAYHARMAAVITLMLL